MKRFLIVLFVFFILLEFSFSQDINNCNINIIENANLTQNINTNLGNCLNVTIDNIVLDCKGFDINGSGNDKGISIIGSNNVTVQNCNIYNFSDGILIGTVTDSLFSNILVENNADNGILIGTLTNSQLIDIVANYNTNNGIYVSGSTNNNLTLIDAHYNNRGIMLTAFGGNNIGNNISNSNVKFNTVSNIYFEAFPFAYLNINNKIENNYLGNSSKISNSQGSWSIFFNTDFSNNYYTDMSGFLNGDCFDASNNACDYTRQLEIVSSSKNSNIFPFESFTSQFVGIVLIIVYFLFI